MSNVIEKTALFHIAGIHTCVPGKIVSYDPVRQEATVKVLINDVFLDDREFEVPEIDGVPVVFPSAGGGAITFPIKENDGVLILFSERSLEVWAEDTTGDPVSPGDKRRHNVTDAIAIPGLTPFTQALGSNQDDVEIKFAGSSFLLKSNGDVEITPATGSLKVNGIISATDVQVGSIDGDENPITVSLKDHIHSTPEGPSGPPVDEL